METLNEMLKKSWAAAKKYQAFMLSYNEIISESDCITYQAGYLKCLKDRRQEEAAAVGPTWEEIKLIIEGQLRIGDAMKYSNYNNAGLIATELRLKFNIQNK